MGWRTQDAYDREERERSKAVPLRSRYDWWKLAAIGAGIIAVSTALWWTH